MSIYIKKIKKITVTKITTQFLKEIEATSSRIVRKRIASKFNVIVKLNVFIQIQIQNILHSNRLLKHF